MPQISAAPVDVVAVDVGAPHGQRQPMHVPQEPAAPASPVEEAPEVRQRPSRRFLQSAAQLDEGGIALDLKAAELTAAMNALPSRRVRQGHAFVGLEIQVTGVARGEHAAVGFAHQIEAQLSVG
jgi:hypothetical protein